jgi:hypothetical protein
MRGRALVDLRNIYKPHEVLAAGLDHFPVGLGGRGGADVAARVAAE